MSKLNVSTLGGIAAGNNIVSLQSGHKLYTPGSVVQVVTATSGFINQTINSATPVLLSGLSVAITPKFNNSIILIQGMVTASWSYVSSIHIYKNGSDMIPSHAAAGTNSQSGGNTALWTHYQSSQEAARANQVFPFPVLYQDIPGVTTSITYDFRANSGWSGGTEAFYFNNRTGTDMLGSSFITVMEIAQ